MQEREPRKIQAKKREEGMKNGMKEKGRKNKGNSV